MALSPRRAAERFRSTLQSRFGFQIDDIEILTLLYQAMIDEIKEEMEAINHEIPGEGLFVEVTTGTGTEKVKVEGESTTGQTKKGNFR
jgi:hypothetical protein